MISTSNVFRLTRYQDGNCTWFTYSLCKADNPVKAPLPMDVILFLVIVLTKNELVIL